MGRRKKPENETSEETSVRLTLEMISNHANRSEKTAWKHKLGKMGVLIEQLRPIEDKIIKIIAEEKQPLMDKIADLRYVMVKECVHPFEHLIMKDGFIECKFCNKKLRVPNGKEKEL